MRDGRVRFSNSHRLHLSYTEPDPLPDPSQGLTPMNIQAVRARMRNREVPERKQVGDVESLINAEKIVGIWED